MSELISDYFDEQWSVCKAMITRLRVTFISDDETEIDDNHDNQMNNLFLIVHL